MLAPGLLHSLLAAPTTTPKALGHSGYYLCTSNPLSCLRPFKSTLLPSLSAFLRAFQINRYILMDMYTPAFSWDSMGFSVPQLSCSLILCPHVFFLSHSLKHFTAYSHCTLCCVMKGYLYTNTYSPCSKLHACPPFCFYSSC